MSAKEVSQYYTLLNVIILSGSISTIGLSNLVQKTFARNLKISEQLNLILKDIKSRLILIFIVCLFSVYTLITFEGLLNLSLFILISLLFCFSNIFYEIIRFSLNATISEVARNISRPCALILLLLLGLDVVFSLIFSFVIEFIVALYLATIRYKPISINHLDRETHSELLKLFLMNGLIIIYAQIDISILSKVFSDNDFATFIIANRYGFLMSLMLYVGNVFLVRHITNLFRTNDSIWFYNYELALNQVRFFSIFYWIILFCTFFLYESFMAVTDPNAIKYFLVISVSFLIQAMLGPINILFINLGKSSFLIKTNIVLFGIFLYLYNFFLFKINPIYCLGIIYTFPILTKIIPLCYFNLYLRKQYEH
jgi:O-antigen/teichoic acid export membrane protein